MGGCKRAGGTPLGSRDKPTLRNGRRSVWACGVWGGFAGEAAVLQREFLLVPITQRLR